MRIRGSLDRNGTIRGSLRYNAKVALQLKRAQANVESYGETSRQIKRHVQEKREKAKTRLKSRLMKRASKKDERAPMVLVRGNCDNSDAAVVLPVRLEPSLLSVQELKGQ